MANHDKDNIPTLSDTHPKSVDENVDSRFRPFLSRTQSASTSIPLDSMESYGSETNIVGFTGPLRSARKAPLVQMSGPLYINRNTENLFLAKHGVTTRKKVDSKPEKYPSLNGRDKNDWDDNYTATNAHLMRSGQLGMCNDPYCTTCPLYYHSTASQQRHAKTSSIFDSKVCFCSNMKNLIPPGISAMLFWIFTAATFCPQLYEQGEPVSLWIQDLDFSSKCLFCEKYFYLVTLVGYFYHISTIFLITSLVS
jgi:cyclic nucleotide gated channel